MTTMRVVTFRTISGDCPGAACCDAGVEGESFSDPAGLADEGCPDCAGRVPASNRGTKSLTKKPWEILITGTPFLALLI
jgi:hypothetical protein